jgi:hypothetical protein
MGYGIRILGRVLTPVSLKLLRQSAEPALIEADEGVEDDWLALILRHASGEPIAFIEKNPVREGELGGEELKEFIEELPYYKPDSAVAWLKEYLPNVKVIYSFQLLNGTDVADGFELMHKVYGAVWRLAGGILQADQEGFTNELGHNILWQFGDHVTGECNMGILATGGEWINFRMDLGNGQQKADFLKGKLPVGAKLICDDEKN